MHSLFYNGNYYSRYMINLDGYACIDKYTPYRTWYSFNKRYAIIFSLKLLDSRKQI